MQVQSRPPSGWPALVLNADFRPLSYYPLSIWPWEEVVKAVYQDRVDVVSTRNTRNGVVSETIVHNVKVLAINLRLGETGKTGAPSDPDSPNKAFQKSAIATLELLPEQGEQVINAARVGAHTGQT